MDFKDYYKILGVNENAEPADIKKAYRKQARKYHPDVSDEEYSEDKFKEASEAYEVLKDPEKRAEYDQLRKMGARGEDGRFRPPPDWESAAHFSQGGYSDANAAGFSDFFESIFGRAGSVHRNYQGDSNHGDNRNYQQSGFQQVRMRGEDVHLKVPVFIEEANLGCERVIEYKTPRFDEYGLLNHESRKIKVKIPAGSSPAKPMRLKGQGGKGMGGAENGDLFIDLEFAPHPIYSVKGDNLYRKLAIAPWEAALGASIKIPTLSGEVQLTVPPDSQSGQQLRLRGKGLKGTGSNRGDLYIELDIVVPKVSSGKVKSLYAELAKECAFNPRAEKTS